MPPAWVQGDSAPRTFNFLFLCGRVCPQNDTFTFTEQGSHISFTTALTSFLLGLAARFRELRERQNGTGLEIKAVG